MNRARKFLFGDASLQIFGNTPADGETELAELAEDWRAKRVTPTTDGTNQSEKGGWQFEIAAPADWETEQTYMLKATALMVGERRWKISKVEKPIGESLVWKLKAQIQ